MTSDQLLMNMVYVAFSLLCVGLVCLTVYCMYEVKLKAAVIRDKGYPPAHCDAMGKSTTPNEDWEEC